MYKYFKATFFIWLVFLISPISSVLISLKNFRAPWVKNVLWAFVVFYGFNFVIYDEMMDANRYAEKLVNLHRTEVGLDNFFDLFLSDEESSYLDVAGPITAFLVSRFTENSSVLFGIYAMIFGFFYSRNLWFLLDRTTGKLKPAAMLLLLIIFLMIPFWSINGFRFWTASQVFIFGMLPYIFVEKKLKYFLIASSSILFHFSFFIPLVILFFSYAYTKNLTILFYAFLASFLFSFIELQPLQDFLLQHAPDFLHKKLTTYVNADYAENLEVASAGAKWFITLKYQTINFLALSLISLCFLLHREFIRSNPVFFNSFCLILYLAIANNVLSSIPSVGRFMVLNQYFTFCLAFFLIQHYDNRFVWLKRTLYLATPFLLIFIVYTLRIGLQSMNVMLLTGNPFLSIGAPGKSLLDFFKK